MISITGDTKISVITAKNSDRARLRKSLSEDFLNLRENNNKLMLNAPSQTLPVSSSYNSVPSSTLNPAAFTAISLSTGKHPRRSPVATIIRRASPDSAIVQITSGAPR